MVTSTNVTQKENFTLTEKNFQMLQQSLFSNEDQYRESMNNLDIIVEGLLTVAERLPEDSPKKQQAYSLFNTMNDIVGAIISDKTPPYFRFKRDEEGRWLDTYKRED